MMSRVGAADLGQRAQLIETLRNVSVFLIFKGGFEIGGDLNTNLYILVGFISPQNKSK